MFEEVLARYPLARRGEKFGRGSSFWPLIGELKATLEAVPALAASKRVKVKVSFGQGGWAEVPNFAIMDARETERPSAGLYLVYLVRADGAGLVLSLNQGSGDLIFERGSAALGILRARAAKVREALAMGPLAEAGYDDAPLELAARGEYPRAYAAGNVVSKTYTTGAVPSADVLTGDLAALLSAYQAIIPSTRLRLSEVRAPAVASSRFRA